MSSKVEYLIGYSLKKKLKSKWFKVVNILLLVLMPIICNVDSIIKYFGGDFDKPTNIYVVDSIGVYDEFNEIYMNSNNISLTDSKVTMEHYTKDTEELKNELKSDEKKDVILVLTPSEENVYDVEIISYDLIDTILYQNIVTALNTTKTEIALKLSNIDTEVLDKASAPVSVDRVILNEDANSNSELMQLIGGVAIPLFILPFFFLILMVVQYVGAEINEEKTSKSMEIIISSVSPMAHFISKIISTNVFVLLQGFLLIVYSAVGAFSRVLISKQSFTNSFNGDINSMLTTFVDSGMLNNILKALPFIIILLILSFILCSLIAGILASITTSPEDYSQIQTPLMFILMVGYYLAIVASTFESSAFIKVASYIPLISSILSPVLLVQGQIGIIDVLISLILVVALIAVLLKYGIKVYKVGILNYSSSKLWKKMASAVKSK